VDKVNGEGVRINSCGIKGGINWGVWALSEDTSVRDRGIGVSVVVIGKPGNVGGGVFPGVSNVSVIDGGKVGG